MAAFQVSSAKGRSPWGLRFLLGGLLVAGVLAVAMAVRWAHSSGELSDDTEAEFLAYLAVATGCFAIASFAAGAAVAYGLGLSRAMRDVDEAILASDSTSAEVGRNSH